MSHLMLTVLSIAICLFCLSFRAYFKGNLRIAVLFICLAGLVLRVYAGSDPFLHEWDERYHALVAKHLISHPLTPTLYEHPLIEYDYKDWAKNHIWLHKPPLALWFMALSMKLLGVNEISLRIPSILLSTFCIAITFYLGTFFFNEKVGFWAAFFHSIHADLIRLASGRTATDHVDTVFLFFTELSIALSVIYLKRRQWRYLICIGATFGLAVLTKSLPGLLLVPVCLTLILQKESLSTAIVKLLLLLLICAVTIAPWHFYIYACFSNEAVWEQTFNFRHLTHALEGHAGSIFYYLERMPMSYGAFIWIPIVWFLTCCLKSFKNYKVIAIALWLIIPYVFFSFAKTKMRGYVMLSAPAIFFVYSFFLCEIRAWYYAKKSRIRYTCVGIFSLILLLLPVEQSVSQIPLLEESRSKDKLFRKIMNLQKMMGHGDVVIFNTNNPIETMFYTPYTAYSCVPTEEQIQTMIKKGYKIGIFSKGKIPSTFKNNKNVFMIDDKMLR